MRPYDLRHAFCSLLIGEGMSVVEVARQAGTRRR
jgi:site-specific recombinase XerD